MAAEIILTPEEQAALEQISQATGKSSGELVHEAVDRLITGFRTKDRLSLLRKARGMWKDREDVEQLRGLRAEWDRIREE